MKTILTKKGKEILVDESDFEYLNQFTWGICSGYARTTIRGKHHLMHRLLLNLETHKEITDHVNHNKLDNRRINLRACNHSENGKNRKSSGKSKYLGVSIFISKQKYINKKGELKVYLGKPKYRAIIKIKGKYKHIGDFNVEKDAALAYNEWANKMHGEFANLNIIE